MLNHKGIYDFLVLVDLDLTFSGPIWLILGLELVLKSFIKVN